MAVSTNDTPTTSPKQEKSPYGEQLTVGGRIGLLLVAVFAIGAPIFCAIGVFFIPGFFAGNNGTVADNIGGTGSVIIGIILLAMAKEFWPKGAGALIGAFSKAPPSIHVYAAQRDKAAVEARLDAGADINGRDQFGNTALHIAAFQNDLPLLAALLTRKADISARDKNGETALHKSSERNNFEVVRLLLAQGADKDSRDGGGSTPLHRAAAAGGLESIEALLGAGANPNAVTPEHSLAPLHIAAVAGQDKAAKLLVAAGANKAARTSQGKTPRDLAAQKGHGAIVVALDSGMRAMNPSGG